MRMHEGVLGEAVHEAEEAVRRDDVVARIWARDHTVWADDPTEISDRLGWLDSPAEMRRRTEELAQFAAGVAGDGFTDVVLMGMGGSSLFPEVLARAFGPGPGMPTLHVLDTTDPAALRRLAGGLALERSLFVAASKSGTTLETRSHLAHFWDQVGKPDQFVAITDPGTELAGWGAERGFRRVFEARPDIGGRYSALSDFGLVPGALLGVDLESLLDGACDLTSEEARGLGLEHVGAALGVFLGAAVRRGRDKLTLVVSEELSGFDDWAEQLVAESTGKDGTGALPVVGEPLGPPEVYGDDRVFVAMGADGDLGALGEAGHPVAQLDLTGRDDLGAAVIVWELATAVLGAVLGVHPFDQPDVQSAKDATARVLQGGPPEIPEEPVGPLLERVAPGDYLAICAFVDPGSDVVGELQRCRVALRDRLGVATTFGIGPRFLHSTGQYHKGGPPTGVFLQVVDEGGDDVPIPGQPFGFGTLKRAQAAGDLEALRARGLQAARVSVDDLIDI